MHACSAETVSQTWQVKIIREFTELHGCKTWYIVQLVDYREEAIIQQHQGALFSTWLLCCRYIVIIQRWCSRQALSESTCFLYNPKPRQYLVWHMPQTTAGHAGACAHKPCRLQRLRCAVHNLQQGQLFWAYITRHCFSAKF